MNTQEIKLKQRTSQIWEILSRTFPNAEIWLQRDEGSSMLNILLQDCEQQGSVSVDLREAEQAVHGAVFSVKELLRHFDA